MIVRMNYNPNIHHRRSIRLKGYDYSQAGLYFITICVKNRKCLFGEIEDAGRHISPDNSEIKNEYISQAITLNDAGKMIENWYNELENKFPDIKCHEMVVMPNHIHCIVENVGADLRVCPIINVLPDDVSIPTCIESSDGIATPVGVEGEHIGSPLHRVVQWFKTMTTNEYIRGVKTLGWQPFNGKLWQRNYYEHIIRNDQSYNRISNYIRNNPAKWAADKFNIQ
jgi:putative transposase